ncbi:MAG: hypothetical protein WAZ14_00970 [Patescibacteria group bacterium]
MRCFVVETSGELPEKNELKDPDEFWELEDGLAVLLLVPRDQCPGEFTAFPAVIEIEVVGQWPDGSSKKKIWAVVKT